MNDNESIIDNRALQPLPIVLHVLLYLWWDKSDDRAPTPDNVGIDHGLLVSPNPPTDRVS